MIWLIGNRGMLGTDVGNALRQAGIAHIGSDREVDITDIDALRHFINDSSLSWIVNCSAYTTVDRAEDEESHASDINGRGVGNIAVIAKEKNATVVHISTDYVFDGSKAGAYTEDDATGPVGAYGRSKLLGENLLRETTSRHYILRVAWLYGAHGNNFVLTMLRLFRERDQVRVVSDQWGSPTYTVDVASLIMSIIADGRNNYGTYHFTNEGRTSWYLFANEINALARKYHHIENPVRILPITTAEYPTRARRPMNSYMSKEKIKAAFGIEIPSWQDALERFMAGLVEK